jgi:hypothetical protein
MTTYPDIGRYIATYPTIPSKSDMVPIPPIQVKGAVCLNATIPVKPAKGDGADYLLVRPKSDVVGDVGYGSHIS